MKPGRYFVHIWLLLAAMLPAVAQAQFTFTTNADNTITITRYTGPGGVVTIPGTTNGYPVTSIGNESFDYCTNLTNVAIPDSVTNIGWYVFDSCSRLTAITADSQNTNYSSVDGVLLNKTQTKLIQCPGGKTGNYTIPNTATNIGSFAFDSSTGLTNITIPGSVPGIGEWAFASSF